MDVTYCPSCDQKFVVEIDGITEVVECPHCGKKFWVIKTELKIKN